MAAPGRALPSAARSKWDIREEVWEHLEASGLAEFPRPVRGRIPNFKGSLQACCSLRELDVFSRAREVKVDPDKPLEGARLAALQARKTLLVPTPRLRSGLFNRIVPPPGATKEMLRRCATSQGVRDFSVPVGLDSKAQVDLVVVGSVAVSEKGWRIGKGEGYADMEYAMMVSMGAVQEDTPVVTIVHDCQVLDIAEELLGDHDLTVDYILTPTRTIQTNCKRPKPQGIMWHKVSSEMLGKIPILKTLRCREKQAGKDVTLQDEQPALADTNRAAVSDKKVMAAHPQPRAAPGSAPVLLPHVGRDPVNPKSEGSDSITTVFLGNLPGSLRVSQLKSALRELQVVPAALKWQGAQHRAFLDFREQEAAHRALCSLQGLSLGGNALRVELAKSQRNKGQGEINSHK
ncbi:methenyltetrahydrofolate synthase domain-containing protein isoform X1 [Haemorhous mexicanus]|uniref:methenyltetrahydrofolate synthase domain-containing protein isoform X1 n=1 Tax=Haemorhous mexicanus TaxID=30427 RepID=UPI0028BEE606|nr:methenyltetrahydrofolate synthase domain-containing protein isoform X1 [Haemorhous mexicanus]